MAATRKQPHSRTVVFLAIEGRDGEEGTPTTTSTSGCRYEYLPRVSLPLLGRFCFDSLALALTRLMVWVGLSNGPAALLHYLLSLPSPGPVLSGLHFLPGCSSSSSV